MVKEKSVKAAGCITQEIVRSHDSVTSIEKGYQLQSFGNSAKTSPLENSQKTYNTQVTILTEIKSANWLEYSYICFLCISTLSSSISISFYLLGVFTMQKIEYYSSYSNKTSAEQSICCSLWTSNNGKVYRFPSQRHGQFRILTTFLQKQNWNARTTSMQ